MAGSHVPLDIEREEEEIQRLIDTLLQYKPLQGDFVNGQSPMVKTPTVSREKLGKATRGRPPKTRPSAGSSSTLSAAADDDTRPLYFDVIMECLDKLNKRNKKLVNRIIELDLQVQAQNKKIEDLDRCCIVGTSEDSHLQDEQNVISPIMQLNSVSKRVERLENNESDLPLQSLAKVSE